MLDSIYSAYTGLLSFSKGLTVLSNNVANMNTPGFKASNLNFNDLFYQFSASGGQKDPVEAQVGEGVTTSGTRIDFSQGQLGNTGNPLDAAISGLGFFVLSDGKNTYYTRDGEFQIDPQGFLVDKTNGFRVQGIQGSGGLSDINLTDLQTSAALATTQVSFVGNLSRDATSDQVAAITVYDSVGGSHTLTVNLTNNGTVTAGSWQVQVQDENSHTVGSGTIQFNPDGSPATGGNTLAVTLAPTGAPPSKITLNFGTPGQFSAATNYSGGTTSNLKVSTSDGHAGGSLLTTSFDAQGVITLQYSNNQNAKGPQLALASFNDPETLTQLGNALFSNPAHMPVRYASGNGALTGTLTSNDVELSNVNLTQEFTELVILQRGYQASSQVVTVANQMIQQLTDMRTGGNSGGG
jgi:flagellar hook protein FlgE